ncbi:hypothetical protein SteCoe_31355 [Stentor coeruleus]|uniref:RBR-type E3 ubiquitin transferase n=1 Tax=Stentor coeruleus TaxID=5963 RepID=A0A1R2B1F7_9CILI|nr:hypothetical protein SteCoe_31355 [Stentor coeruleus]
MDNIALRNCSEYLSKALTLKLVSINSPEIKDLLKIYSNLIDHYDFIVKIKVKSLGCLCLHCGVYINSKDLSQSINLQCAEKHYFCGKECIKRHALMSTNLTLLDLHYVRCPGCFIPISIKIIEKAFDGKLESLQQDACDRALKSLLDEDSKAMIFQSKFSCEICFMEYNIEQGITLNCDHRFCEECLRQHISMLIDTAQVTDDMLKCPKCPEPISVYEIEDVAGPELFKKYEKFRLRSMKIDELDDNEILFHCPGNDCEYICIVEKSDNNFECPKCKHKCCPLCKEDSHKNSSCDEYKQWKKENSEVDKLFNQLLEKEGLLRCPECEAVVQRISGCQYMVCSSSECRGKTFFCYDCGIKLEGDHAPHECKPRWKNQNQLGGVIDPVGIFGGFGVFNVIPQRQRKPRGRPRRKK